MTLKFYLGLTSFTFSFIAIFLNMLIFFPVFRMAFVAKKSSVYIIAFFNLISDLIQLSIVCFYNSICIMEDVRERVQQSRTAKYFFQRFVFVGSQDSWGSIMMGWIFINAWYMESLVQIVMAVNRFCIISLKKYDLFTFKFTMGIFLIMIIFTSFLATTTQWMYPCCQFIPSHIVLAWMFINTTSYNWSYVQLFSFDVLCSVSSTICYVAVFFSIRNSYKDAANIKGAGSANQNNKDLKYLIQFVFISVFYVCTWILFEVFPHVVPGDQLEYFWIITALVILNCSSNAVIFLTCNKEIRRALQFPWAKNRRASSLVSTLVTKSTVTNVHN